MGRTKLAVVVAATMLASPVLAGWQNTSWDMSKQQVIAATGASSVLGTPGQAVFGADLGAEGRYSALGFDFQSQFYFDQADRLRVVRLMLDEPEKCPDLLTSLMGIYGRPVESSPISTVWLDVEQNNRIRFTDAMPQIEMSCFVAYSPISTGGASGL